MTNWQRYTAAFIITALIFAAAVIVSGRINDRRIDEIRALQERVSTDILSLETQFDRFEQHLSCENLTENTVLSESLGQLESRLQYAESTLGADDAEVVRLKRSYTLLQIKDLVLMTKITERCGGGPTFILYFYSNEEGECEECTRQGYVLSALSEQFPEELRVYAFDYNLQLGVLETLISLNDVKAELPALIVGKQKVYGYQNLQAMEKLLPRLAQIRAEREAAAAADHAATSTE